MVTSWSCRGPHTFPKAVPERGDGPGAGIDRAGLASACCQGGVPSGPLVSGVGAPPEEHRAWNSGETLGWGCPGTRMMPGTT